MSGYSIEDLVNILPIAFLLGWALVLVLVEAFTKRRSVTIALAAVGLAAAAVIAVMQAGVETSAFKGMLTVDGYAVFIYLLLLVSGLFSVALSYDYGRRMGWARGEYYISVSYTHLTLPTNREV